MIKLIKVPVVSEAVKKAGEIVKKNHEAGRKTLVFCDDAIYLDTERAACEACGGGMFEPFVYTFSSFLGEYGADESTILGRHDSVTIMRRIMQDYINIKKLSCFKSAEVAGDVYDAVSMLYSSHIDVDDLAKKEVSDVLLKKKLGDICFLYGKYFAFLKANGYRDVNTRLSELPKVVNDSGAVDGETDVVFAGFRTFSWFESRVLTGCMSDARNVYGILTGGRGEVSGKFFRPVYTDEAAEIFSECVSDSGAPAECVTEEWESFAPSEAYEIVSRLYNGMSFKEDYLDTGRVHVFEAADAEEELEYVAANIKKLVCYDNARYRDVSVMLPAVDDGRPIISRVFSEYGIPYYIDGKLPLTDCPICSFITDLISCRTENYSPDFVDAVISNPLFDAVTESDSQDEQNVGDVTLGVAEDAEHTYRGKSFWRKKDEFRNYVLLFANYRGGIPKTTAETDKEVYDKAGFVYDDICEVRDRLVTLVDMVPDDTKGKIPASDYMESIDSILKYVGAEKKLEAVSKRFSGERHSESVLYKNAYRECVSAVEKVCGLLCGEKVDNREFLKIIIGAFSSADVKVDGQKLDAVSVGDISQSINPGTDYLFAVGMTNAVPYAREDTSLLTERDLEEIKSVGRIADGAALLAKLRFPDRNAGYRETAGLNVASFGKEIYLSYPLREEGKDDTVPSEIVSYVRKMFCDGPEGGTGKDLEVTDMAKACGDRKFLAALCSNRTAALRLMLNGDEKVQNTIEKFMEERGLDVNGFKDCLKRRGKEDISFGKAVFTGKTEGAVSTTTVEEWFGCPYKTFMEKGLGASPRKTSRDVAPDIGTFVHGVLEKVFCEGKAYGPGDEQIVLEKAERFGGELLTDPAFASFRNQKNSRGEYMTGQLFDEVKKICLGVHRQLVNSDFDVEGTEKDMTIRFFDGNKIKGRVDRIDVATAEGEKLVRVIDYKTGHIDDERTIRKKYYMGQKLQLELYLNAVSEGGIPAGSYYFPARVSFGKETDSNEKFPLVGFMDGDAFVVKASDKSVTEGQSQYIEKAGLGEKSFNDMAMEGPQFANFLKYGILVARNGVREMTEGFIRPTPAAGSCAFCAYSGLCGYNKKSDVPERNFGTPKSKDIAAVAENEAECLVGMTGKLFEVIIPDKTADDSTAGEEEAWEAEDV
ncbi:MAG: PD-(D/E)XK nuclease family protein [Clostridia bacterium]|nr:PD-(D/E)XK nuclease family protein [Clostridia bacterium]